MANIPEERIETLPLPQDSIVLRAALNRALLTPPWLSKVGIIPPGQNVELGLPPHYGDKYLFRTQGLIWTVGDDELTVYGSPEITSRFVAMMLELLPYTPVVAAGVNARRVVRVGEGSPLSTVRKAVTELPDEAIKTRIVGQTVSKSFATIIDQPDGVRAGITVAATESEEVEVAFNFHRASNEVQELTSHVMRAPEFQKLINSLCSS